MRVKILEPNGFVVLTLQFNLLDINISKGRFVIIKSIGNKHGFKVSTSIRKDADAVGYIEFKMRDVTGINKVSLVSKELIKVLL